MKHKNIIYYSIFSFAILGATIYWQKTDANYFKSLIERFLGSAPTPEIQPSRIEPSPVQPSNEQILLDVISNLKQSINEQIDRFYLQLYGKKPFDPLETEEFILVGGLQNPEEHEAYVTTLITPLRQINVAAIDPQIKQTIIKDLQSLNEKLTILQSNANQIEYLIGNNGKEVFDKIAQMLYSSLAQKGIKLDQAYETLNLDPTNKYLLTIDDIQRQSERLTEQEYAKGIGETPLTQKIRQVGYVLRTNLGKQMYDAFLEDYKRGDFSNTEMLKIVPQKAEEAGIAMGMLQQNINPYKMIILSLIEKLRK